MNTIDLTKVGGLVKAVFSGTYSSDSANPSEKNRTIFEKPQNISFEPNEDTGNMVVKIGGVSIVLGDITDLSIGGTAVTDMQDFETQIATVFPDANSGNGGTGGDNLFPDFKILTLGQGWTISKGNLAYDGQGGGSVSGKLAQPLLQNRPYKLRTVTEGTGGIVLQIADATINEGIAANIDDVRFIKTNDTVDTDIYISANGDGFEGSVDLISLTESLTFEDTIALDIPFTSDRNINTGGQALTLNGKSIGIPYKIYTALLNQSGDNNPVQTILQNTIDESLEWIRTDFGTYSLELSNTDINKVFCIAPSWSDQSNWINENLNKPVICAIGVNPPSNVKVEILIDPLGDSNDDVLKKYPIEIRVYP